jgi:hypothetical protein
MPVLNTGELKECMWASFSLASSPNVIILLVVNMLICCHMPVHY